MKKTTLKRCIFEFTDQERKDIEQALKYTRHRWDEHPESGARQALRTQASRDRIDHIARYINNGN